MLKITHLHKTFFPNTPNEKKALRGVSLTLEEGDLSQSSVPTVPASPL